MSLIIEKTLYKLNKNQVKEAILTPESNHNIIQQPVSKGNIKTRH